ncbi:MAG: alpha/beta hydrolase, partial [Hyphomicrobiales bacterium]|nr:alpha/beta hydrolase [Hyphomicrobiales bacterium]
MTKPEKQSAIQVAGGDLRYCAAGEGPTVLFLHGIAGHSWDPLSARLAGAHEVIAPEHPGFGRSPVPEWMLSVGDVAFFYLDVLEALDLRRVHLVGHGIGGWIAAEIAIRSCERLASLALLAPAGVQSARAPFDDIFAWSSEELAQRQFHDPAAAAQWQQARAALDIDIILQDQTALARLAWTPRLCNLQLPFWLHRIAVPTLLVWGENDRVIPLACHETFKQEIRDAELLVLPRSGHALPIERADELAPRLAT